jgi:hypothetical protein
MPCAASKDAPRRQIADSFERFWAHAGELLDASAGAACRTDRAVRDSTRPRP